MNKLAHRPGVSETDLVTRKLRLQPSSLQQIDAAIEAIDSMFGLDCIEFDQQTAELHLAYDASHLGLDAIEQVLQEYGIRTGQSFWLRLRYGYYRYVDQNIKDNKHHKPWSCHKK